MSDHYNLLGVPPGASTEEIRQAFRREAKRSHPDLHAQRPPAEREALHRRFIQLAQAYQVLGDPEQRKAYDRRRAAERLSRGATGPAAEGVASQASAARPAAQAARPASARPRPPPGSPPHPRPAAAKPDLAELHDILNEAEHSLSKFGLDLRQPTEVVLEELLDWARALYRDLAGAVRGKDDPARAPQPGPPPRAKLQPARPGAPRGAAPRAPESDAAGLNELSVERELDRIKRGVRSGSSPRAATVDDELADLKRKLGKKPTD
jgi:curved DNA-binding protein CbpA